MMLFHATPAANIQSILAQGLLVSKTDPALAIQRIWLHTRSRRAWAVAHTQVKHKVRIEEVVLLAIAIPRSRVLLYRRGLYYTLQDIVPERIVALMPGVDMGASVSPV